MTEDEVRRRREARRRFLEILYDHSERGESEYQDGYDLAAEIGVSRQDAERIVRYHEDHGFIAKSAGVRGGLTVRITARGIDHVEQETG